MANQNQQQSHRSTHGHANPFVPQSRNPVRDDWDDVNLSDAEIGESASNFDEPAKAKWPGYNEDSSEESDDDGQSLAYSTLPPQLVWPSRLLDVNTMVSYERKKIGEDFSYNNVRNPRYSTISYTWGRYQVKDGDKKGMSIAVSGVDWDVPSIMMNHFTPDMLQHVLKIATEETGWVWLDVACIDQSKKTHQVVKELGKQSAIFSKATRQYIWLSDLLHAEINQAAKGMEKMATKSHTQILEYNSEQQGDIIRLFESSWFSSLWTLQEAYFCKSATILSREGKTIEVSNLDNGSVEALTLNWLISASNALDSTVVKRPLSQSIERAGISRLKASNPMVALRSSIDRVATIAEDRIYGIMQVFNLEIVNITNSFPNLQVDELEMMLAQGINMHSPAIGQGFVHPVASRNERAATKGFQPRRRDGRSTNKRVGGVVPGFDFSFQVPLTLYDAEEVEYDKKAQISFHSSRPRFQGYKWDLEDVEKQWTAQHPDIQRNTLYMSVFMDEGTFITRQSASQIPVRNLVTGAMSVWPEVNLISVLRGLLERFPGELKVLVLGKLRSSSETGYIGMIVAPGDSGGVWRRVGICSWPQETDKLQKFSCSLSTRIFYDRTEGHLYGNDE